MNSYLVLISVNRLFQCNNIEGIRLMKKIASFILVLLLMQRAGVTTLEQELQEQEKYRGAICTK